MDFKKLHEDLVTMVEKTIDPKFRDAIKRTEQNRMDKINKALERPDVSDYRRGELEKGKKQKHAARRVYTALAKKGLDVEQSTIEFIGTGADLDGKKLKNILKEKMDKEDYNNGPNRVLLILDKHLEASDWYPEESRDPGFCIWTAYYQDGRFYLDDYSPESGFDGYTKGRNLMADLNAKNKWLQNKDFYMAFGKSTQEKRDERIKNRIPDSQRRYRHDVNQVWGLDKSGYDLKDAKNDLERRLKEYKKNNGTYTKQIEELRNQLNSLLPKVQEVLSNVDFNQGIETPQEVMKMARKAVVDINYINSGMDSNWNDDSTMRYRIDVAKKSLERLEILLEK